MKKTLHVNVTNKVATYQKRDGAIVCGNDDYEVKFIFDAEWADITNKTARFLWNGDYYDVDFSGDTCDAPVIKGATTVEVGVYAGDLETTTGAEIPCLLSVLCKGGSPHPETGQHYTAEAVAAAEAAKVSETNAKASETGAENSAKVATEKANSASDSASSAQASADSASFNASAAKGYMEVAQGIAADSVNMDARITRNSKRITNLEQGLTPDPFETDNTVAYQKDVPSNALPYAEISKIGGMTRKCANLVTYPYTVKTSTQAGVTITVNDSGSVVLNGTAEYGLYLKLCDVTYRAGVNYTLSGCPSGGGNSAYAVYDDVLKKYDIGSGITFNVDTDIAGAAYIKLEKGQTVNNLTFYPMLNEGSTALPYELYYDGLRSAPVTEVKSVGANLLDYNNPYGLKNCSVSDGVVTQDTADTKTTIQFKIGAKQDTKIVRDFIFQEISAVGLVSCSFVKTEDFNVLYFGLNGSTLDTLVNYNVSHLKNGMTYYLQFNVTNLNQGSVSWTDMGVYKHQQETFIPYVEHTLPIPAEVRPANGINETVYDYIEWEADGTRKTLNKVIERILIDGVNCNTAYQSSSINHAFLIYNAGKSVKAKGNALCPDFPCTTYIKAYNGARGIYISGNELYVSFGKDSGIITIDACNDYFKNNPTVLCYDLVTPEVTDISDLITSDNLIGVEGGGILTFENEYGYAVPSEVTYQLKGVTA